MQRIETQSVGRDYNRAHKIRKQHLGTCGQCCSPRCGPSDLDRGVLDSIEDFRYSTHLRRLDLALRSRCTETKNDRKSCIVGDVPTHCVKPTPSGRLTWFRANVRPGLKRRFPRGLFASHFLHGRQPSVVLSSVVEFDPAPLQPRDRATVFFQGCLTEYRIVTPTIKRYA